MSEKFRQKYLLAPGANGYELLNSLAAFGQDCFGVKVVSDFELAKIAYFNAGFVPPSNLISDEDALKIFARILSEKEIAYFKTASFVDVQNIVRSINLLRCNMPFDEEVGFAKFCKCAEFAEKNNAIYELCSAYRDELKEADAIDKIDFIRKASEVCEMVSDDSKNRNDITALDDDIILAEEFPLTPLQKHLVNSVFREKNIHSISLKNANATDGLQNHAQVSFSRAYGAINEVEHLFANIAGTNTPLDKCLVLLSKPSSYVNLIYDFCVEHDIPVTFGCGLPVTMSNAASMLLNMQNWVTTGIFGKDALSKMIYHESFNTQKLCEDLKVESGECHVDCEAESEDSFEIARENLSIILDLAGSLRLSFDADSNSQKLERYKQSGFKFPQKFGKSIVDETTFKATQRLANIIEEGPVKLLQNYWASINCANQESWQVSLRYVLEDASMRALASFLDTYISIYGVSHFSEAVPLALNQRVAAQQSAPGFIHVESIDRSLSVLRKNIHILGMSADKFPGSPRENYLVLDNDLHVLREHYELDFVPTSQWKVEHKVSNLLAFYTNAANNNCNLNLSWPHFNSYDLKELNPSSVVYELYRRANNVESVDFEAFNSDVKTVGFFDYCFDSDFEYKRAYRQGIVVEKKIGAEVEEHNLDALTNEQMANMIKISPSRAATLTSCPFAFYLDSLLGLSSFEEDEPRVALPACDSGSMAHKCMELFSAERTPTRDDFVAYGLKLFDEFMAYRPAFFADAESDAREDFEELLLSAYAQNQAFSRTPVEAEKFLSAKINGFEVRGFVDRIETDDAGNTTIVDFKTGRNFAHANQDPASCIQGLLYAYILGREKNATAEFRYPRRYNPNFQVKNFSVVSCDYEREDVDEYFEDLRERLKDFEFEPGVAQSKRDYDCKYCSFRKLCDAESDFSTRSVEKLPSSLDISSRGFETERAEKSGDCSACSDSKPHNKEKKLHGSFSSEQTKQSQPDFSDSSDEKLPCNLNFKSGGFEAEQSEKSDDENTGGEQ